MDWVWRNFFDGADIWGLTLDHIGLSVPPIIIGFVLSIPLGYWASRSRTARSVLLSVGGILYAIPSLVLLVVVPVTLGLPILDPKNVIFGLSVYAVAIMVRSSADAFAAVPDDVKSTATAVGYSRAQRFFTVELPLAGPVLLAGIRVVSVSTVSLVTIGSVIGISSLGNLFTNGFNIDFPTEIYTGIVAVLIIAAVFDLILSTVGRILMPWNRHVGARALARRSKRAVATQ
jgi:osmoprotectant transport system permease protein